MMLPMTPRFYTPRAGAWLENRALVTLPSRQWATPHPPIGLGKIIQMRFQVPLLFPGRMDIFFCHAGLLVGSPVIASSFHSLSRSPASPWSTIVRYFIGLRLF